ncbi:hypothetical protein Tcan_15595 [Toxocara canis]|uniref:Uncharacterized protein n=2 Tax=Toxocara canis TaxID=6265 RepID=A0A0B2VB21_TOXCA|nr:hypothetical protein Tcan_15595 [Toxocara canis]VDM43318.1 unnamed protein product [Toxocara canis]
MKTSTRLIIFTLFLAQLCTVFSRGIGDERIRSKRCCNYGYGVGGSNLGYGYGMGSYFYGHYGGGYNNNYGGTNIGSINTKNINA